MKSYTRQELSLIWLDSFSGLEYKHKQMLLSLAGEQFDASLIVQKGKEYLINNLNVNIYSTLKNALTKEYMQFVLDGLKSKGIRVVTIKSQGYPQSLLQTSHPPLVLYTKGDISLLNADRLFAVVGSRKTPSTALAVTENYVKALIDNGFTLVTGIADGVDKKVLLTALSKNAKVISVVTGGVDNVYPKANQSLADKVAESGLVISENPPQTVTLPYMFPIRNRIFAGLSQGVLITSAAKKSGTLWTASCAVEYGKDVFAIPYSVGVSHGEGCNSLIKQGAMLTDAPEDILNHYGIKVKESQKPQLTDEEKQIVNILKQGELHVEKISAGLNKRAFEIMPLLSVLEIKGIVAKNGNLYQLTGNFAEE